MAATYISAGAGSGKTYKLTHMLADRMVPQTNTEPIDASGIILTTFTKSAAADFSGRRGRFSSARIDLTRQPNWMEHLLEPSTLSVNASSGSIGLNWA